MIKIFWKLNIWKRHTLLLQLAFWKSIWLDKVILLHVLRWPNPHPRKVFFVGIKLSLFLDVHDPYQVFLVQNILIVSKFHLYLCFRSGIIICGQKSLKKLLNIIARHILLLGPCVEKKKTQVSPHSLAHYVSVNWLGSSVSCWRVFADQTAKFSSLQHCTMK